MSWSPQPRIATPSIDVQIQSPLWDAEPAAAQTVRAAIVAAAALVPAEGEISVLLTDDAGVRDLNRTWRGLDQPTNVLSFPAAKPVNRPGGALLGDIAVAYETLAREAAADAKPFGHHLAHLVVHGFLHLLGYDHQTDSQADAMEGLERAALARLDIADPYDSREHLSREQQQETGNA
jgi:probable rRNA maturation factor